jgi:hypothetical protein
LVSQDLPLTTLIDIVGKNKKILTYTQEITRVKLERLHSARLIPRDQTNMTRHAKTLNKTNQLISLLH